ncbi:Cmg1p [Sporobolomyces koalae]|uniref:Cmg1p n=1 Tax=Sporobolomyces koalae TaxID=500713 RepID=UPI00317C39F2
MSDSEPDFDDPRFLVDVPITAQEDLSYVERRKRQKIESERKGRTRSRKQLEEEARDHALADNLVDKAHRDGIADTNKALNMMKAMGFKPGEALGKQPTSNPPSSGFARASFAPTSTPATASTSAATQEPRTEPIKFQMRIGRTGLGIAQPVKPRVIPSTASTEATGGIHSIDSTPLPDLDRFLTHVRATIDSKRAFGILKSLRRTLEELDRRNGVDENPMWHDPDDHGSDPEVNEFRNKRLFARLDKEIEASSDDDDENEGQGGTRRDGRGQEQRREQSELDYLRGKSDTVVDNEEEEQERERQLEQQRQLERAERKAARGSLEQEQAEWFAFDISTRLALTLSYLRNHYHYCFYCGCQYNDAQDLAENCPGTEEDDH